MYVCKKVIIKIERIKSDIKSTQKFEKIYIN